MKYTDFKEGEIVEYQGCIGRVFALVKDSGLNNILIEYDSKTTFNWNSIVSGTIPRGKTLNENKWYHYSYNLESGSVKKKEAIYEIY